MKQDVDKLAEVLNGLEDLKKYNPDAVNQAMNNVLNGTDKDAAKLLKDLQKKMKDRGIPLKADPQQITDMLKDTL